MIQVTLQFPSYHEAHAALGTLMANQTILGTQRSVPQAEVADQANDAMESPKTKRKAKAKKPEPKPTPPPTSKESAADSDPLQVLRLALAEYSKTHGFKAATDLLKEFQIKRLPELPEDRYDDFTEALSLIPSADVT